MRERNFNWILNKRHTVWSESSVKVSSIGPWESLYMFLVNIDFTISYSLRNTVVLLVIVEHKEGNNWFLFACRLTSTTWLSIYVSANLKNSNNK